MKFGTLFACSVGVVAAIAADSFGGIGLVLLENRNGIVVKNIVPGTPAANADLNVGDRIISVDGEFLQQKSLENILPLFRGADKQTYRIDLCERRGYSSDNSTSNDSYNAGCSGARRFGL